MSPEDRTEQLVVFCSLTLVIISTGLGELFLELHTATCPTQPKFASELNKY